MTLCSVAMKSRLGPTCNIAMTCTDSPGLDSCLIARVFVLRLANAACHVSMKVELQFNSTREFHVNEGIP